MKNFLVKRDVTRSKRGFTLLETFVAVTILVIAILGPLTLATRGVFAAIAARDQLAATYLAEDALEAIRYIRDTNWLQDIAPSSPGEDWLRGLDFCKEPDGCFIDTTRPYVGDDHFTGQYSILPCSGLPGGICPNMYLTDSNSDGIGEYYTYDGWGGSIKTPFIRTVHIAPAAGNQKEYLVTVTVAWNTGVLQRELKTEMIIYDWYNAGNE